jgi:hypothetical protein
VVELALSMHVEKGNCGLGSNFVMDKYITRPVEGCRAGGWIGGSGELVIRKGEQKG